ncbi:MAG: hypothetical protein D6741_17935, partial [Planctomycetota bacterium]
MIGVAVFRGLRLSYPYPPTARPPVALARIASSDGLFRGYGMDADRAESAKLDARSAILDSPRDTSEKLRAILMLGIFVVLPVLAATWPTVRRFVRPPTAGDETPPDAVPNEPLLALETPQAAPTEAREQNPFARELAEASRVVAQTPSESGPVVPATIDGAGNAPSMNAPYSQWTGESRTSFPIETAAVESRPVASPPVGGMSPVLPQQPTPPGGASPSTTGTLVRNAPLSGWGTGGPATT